MQKICKVFFKNSNAEFDMQNLFSILPNKLCYLDNFNYFVNFVLYVSSLEYFFVSFLVIIKNEKKIVRKK